MSLTDEHWRIPYGVADFIKLRQGHEYYVDKTHYLPLLEQAGRFLFLIRPRRFGKSLLQSVMECYYDAGWAERFDELFADTWIHQRPTTEKGQYLCLRFDFSAVSSTPAEVRESFEGHTRIILEGVLERNRARLPAGLPERVAAETTLNRRLERLIDGLLACNLQLYLFIDEYDNFANNILVNAGREAYRELTHSSGFFRDFFALLKEAVGRTGSGLARLFITGVSPITLDDVTSGFNIGTNISLEPEFNALLGFTHAELERLFTDFGQDFSAHRAIIDEWYNGYHFHKARREPVVNSDMALYYLRALVRRNEPPDDLIDHNVRIDYGKLRHLVQIDRQLADREAAPTSAGGIAGAARLNGNFSRLRRIIETGEEVAALQTSFPAEGLLRQDNFVSLLYYLGLLSFAGEREGRPLLKIPNRTVRQLMYGYLRDAYDEVGCPSASRPSQDPRGGFLLCRQDRLCPAADRGGDALLPLPPAALRQVAVSGHPGGTVRGQRGPVPGAGGRASAGTGHGASGDPAELWRRGGAEPRRTGPPHPGAAASTTRRPGRHLSAIRPTSSAVSAS
jgi:hypothetical protein